jgi:hypothetical protein
MRWRPMMLTSVLREAIPLKQDCQVPFVKELEVFRRAYVRPLLDIGRDLWMPGVRCRQVNITLGGNNSCHEIHEFVWPREMFKNLGTEHEIKFHSPATEIFEPLTKKLQFRIPVLGVGDTVCANVDPAHLRAETGKRFHHKATTAANIYDALSINIRQKLQAAPKCTPTARPRLWIKGARGATVMIAVVPRDNLSARDRMHEKKVTLGASKQIVSRSIESIRDVFVSASWATVSHGLISFAGKSPGPRGKVRGSLKSS